MAVLDENTKNQVKDILKAMTDDVELLFFNSPSTQFGSQIDELLGEVVELSDKLKLSKFTNTSPEVEVYHVDKFPCIIIKGKNKGRISFNGIPSGYEFSTFLEDLIMTSTGEAGLSESTVEFVKSLKEPLHLMVFVTPTCPYCPRSVKLAHQLAMISDKVNSEMIEAMEFEELSRKYNVSGVPHTVINDGKGEFVGAYPEDAAVEEIKKVL